MKIKSKILIQKIEKQDYLQDLESIKYSDITNAKLKTIAQKMIQEVIQASKNNSLLQTELVITGQRPATFVLESNIINLPVANYKKITNFRDEDSEYDINIYVEVISEYINISKFRIDLLAPVADIVAEPDQWIDKLVLIIKDKLTEVRNYNHD